MAIIKSGADADLLDVGSTSKALEATGYSSVARALSAQYKNCFSVSGSFTPPATPTDLIKITGSMSKLVRVVSIYLLTTNTAAGSQQFFLVKRNSDNSGGTFIIGTPTPTDCMDMISPESLGVGCATAIAGHYTANPGALGNSVGTLNIVRRASTVAAVNGVFGTVSREPGGEMMPWVNGSIIDKFVTLRGPSQILAVNFAGAALVAGQVHNYRIVWMED